MNRKPMMVLSTAGLALFAVGAGTYWLAGRSAPPPAQPTPDLVAARPPAPDKPADAPRQPTPDSDGVKHPAPPPRPRPDRELPAPQPPVRPKPGHGVKPPKPKTDLPPKG